jgi:hypothetical protein
MIKVASTDLKTGDIIRFPSGNLGMISSSYLFDDLGN